MNINSTYPLYEYATLCDKCCYYCNKKDVFKDITIMCEELSCQEPNVSNWHWNPRRMKNDFRKRFVDYELEILHITDKVINNSLFEEKISSKINESVVQKFYSDNLEKYKQQERRILNYVKLLAWILRHIL